MNRTPTIAVTIIGHNEAGHLEELLPGLTWPDEVIYVDCESRDRSLQIARSHGCAVFSRPNNPNLNVNKSFAMQQVTADWIFYLDPDERISEALAAEIRHTIAADTAHSAFTLNRRNHYFGRWLRHGSQYPDVQLRLFRRGFASFPQRHVHEKLQVKGSIGHLNEDLLHYPYQSISQYLHKFDFYTGFEARYLKQAGKRPSFVMAWRYWFSIPASRFIRRYFFKQGFRDGWPGFFAALFDSLNFMVRYFKLLEESKK